MRYPRRAWTTLIICLCLSSTALAQDASNDDLRRELDALRRTVEDQARKIQALEDRPAASSSELQAAIAELVKSTPGDSLRLPATTKKGSTFTLYGFLRADAIYNDSRAALNNQVIGWALSEDRTAPPGVGAGGDDRGDFTIHPRLTRFGVDFDGGTLKVCGDARVTGKIEVDFYEGGSQSRSRLRMRKAYLNLAWDDVSLLAGQTTDLISPLYTSVNSDLAMWGAGNLGDRRPQVRLTYAPKSGDATWFFQGMAGQTGAIDGQNLDPAGTFGTTISDGQKSGKPTLQGRVAYQTPTDAGKLELGAWVHRAWEDPDTRVGTAAQQELTSSGFGVDVQIPIVKDLLSFKGEWFSGRNLDDVRGGIFQGVNAATGREIATEGGFAELVLRTAGWMTWHVGYSQDDPSDSDLGVGGRAKNEVWWLATQMDFDPVVVGVEFMDWRTKYVGFGDGDLKRVAVYAMYKF